MRVEVRDFENLIFRKVFQGVNGVFKLLDLFLDFFSCFHWDLHEVEELGGDVLRLLLDDPEERRENAEIFSGVLFLHHEIEH